MYNNVLVDLSNDMGIYVTAIKEMVDMQIQLMPIDTLPRTRFDALLKEVALICELITRVYYDRKESDELPLYVLENINYYRKNICNAFNHMNYLPTWRTVLAYDYYNYDTESDGDAFESKQQETDCDTEPEADSDAESDADSDAGSDADSDDGSDAGSDANVLMINGDLFGDLSGEETETDDEAVEYIGMMEAPVEPAPVPAPSPSPMPQFTIVINIAAPSA